MRFRTIWTMPSLPLRERWVRTKDWVALETAIRLPKSVKYWAVIHVAGKAAGQTRSPQEVTINEMLDAVGPSNA